MVFVLIAIWQIECRNKRVKLFISHSCRLKSGPSGIEIYLGRFAHGVNGVKTVNYVIAHSKHSMFLPKKHVVGAQLLNGKAGKL